MPEVRENENKDEFIDRCMDKLIGEEGRDPSQSRAICEDLWDNRDQTIKVTDEYVAKLYDKWLKGIKRVDKK